MLPCHLVLPCQETRHTKQKIDSALPARFLFIVLRSSNTHWLGRLRSLKAWMVPLSALHRYWTSMHGPSLPPWHFFILLILASAASSLPPFLQCFRQADQQQPFLGIHNPSLLSRTAVWFLGVTSWVSFPRAICFHIWKVWANLIGMSDSLTNFFPLNRAHMACQNRAMFLQLHTNVLYSTDDKSSSDH